MAVTVTWAKRGENSRVNFLKRKWLDTETGQFTKKTLSHETNAAVRCSGDSNSPCGMENTWVLYYAVRLDLGHREEVARNCGSGAVKNCQISAS